MRVGDAYVAHGCPSCPQPSHSRALAAGSSTVYINGKPAGRIGDAIDCGGTAQTGSPDVYIGDGT
ncbi:PAAR domain-containing protein [Endobacterium cereale]|nr:PAAR domain-containing protein [Endobacterium cereale]